MSFKDYFSKQSDIYLKARPTYPAELFEYLAGIAPAKDVCWDCATGNGQAAVSLSEHFKKVIATDGSQKQINNAIARPNIEYKVGTAEESGLPDNYCDLITVATGAHWFELDKFYKEAQRIAKHNGILAIWTYGEPMVNPEIDKVIVNDFAYGLLENYWPDGRWYVRNRYETLPFPFEAIKTPDFFCNRLWSKEEMFNYARSWSSYNAYVTKHQNDPLEQLKAKLTGLWNDTEKKEVTWKLYLKCTKLN